MENHIIYQVNTQNLNNFVQVIEEDGTPILTDNELDAMLFESYSSAMDCIENQLNPSGTEFWGTRPTRPR